MSFVKPIATLALLAFAASATQTAAQDTGDNPRLSDLVDDLIYGIYCAEEPLRQEPAPETASGVINIVPGLPEIRFQQFVVPAERNIGFGVLVRLVDDVSFDAVQVTVTHPPFRESGVEVERWITSLNGGTYSLMGFTFDNDEEEVPGPWTFSAEAAGDELFHVAFEVVPGAVLPGVAIACMGGAIS